MSQPSIEINKLVDFGKQDFDQKHPWAKRLHSSNNAPLNFTEKLSYAFMSVLDVGIYGQAVFVFLEEELVRGMYLGANQVDAAGKVVTSLVNEAQKLSTLHMQQFSASLGQKSN